MMKLLDTLHRWTGGLIGLGHGDFDFIGRASGSGLRLTCKGGRGKTGDESDGRSGRGKTNGHKERSIERFGSFHLRGVQEILSEESGSRHVRVIFPQPAIAHKGYVSEGFHIIFLRVFRATVCK